MRSTGYDDKSEAWLDNALKMCKEKLVSKWAKSKHRSLSTDDLESLARDIVDSSGPLTTSAVPLQFNDRAELVGELLMTLNSHYRRLRADGIDDESGNGGEQGSMDGVHSSAEYARWVAKYTPALT